MCVWEKPEGLSALAADEDRRSGPYPSMQYPWTSGLAGVGGGLESGLGSGLESGLGLGLECGLGSGFGLGGGLAECVVCPYPTVAHAIHESISILYLQYFY